MRKLVFLFGLCSMLLAPVAMRASVSLTTDQFCARVVDFRSNEGWYYLGDKPCLVDFSAAWCGWCKKLEPIFEELEHEYCDQIRFYQVDCDREVEVARAFGIRSYPTILLIRADGKPQLVSGYHEKAFWVQLFNDFLLKSE